MVIYAILHRRVPGQPSSLLHCTYSIKGIRSKNLIVLHNTRMPTRTFSSNFYYILHNQTLKVFFSV